MVLSGQFNNAQSNILTILQSKWTTLTSKLDLPFGTGTWLTRFGYVLARNVSNQEIDGSCQLCSICFAYVDNSLATYHWFVPTSTADWLNKGQVMCYHVSVMHIKDP